MSVCICVSVYMYVCVSVSLCVCVCENIQIIFERFSKIKEVLKYCPAEYDKT